jgi:outer membrane protein TolC
MNPNNMAGITMNIPVFSSGSRKHKLEQAKIQLDQARFNRELIHDQLQMQEEQLRLDLKTALENYTAQKENVEVAKRAFNSTSNKFDQGLVSSLDLTQSNSNYLQAETSLIQSMMSLLQAKLALDKLYNQL